LFLFSADRHEEAFTALGRGREAGRGLNHVQYLSWLYEAWFSLELGREESAVASLRQAFVLAAAQGYVNSPHWNSAMMAKLCAFALEHNVESGYAQTLIRRRALAPPDTVTVSGSWPWPVQIYVLGRLRLKVKGEQPASARKAPRKLLELLALLVASGESGVSVERAMEALWPALGGTRSREALRVAIHRLRRLLDGDDYVLTADGRIALNTSCCWVDAWAFERALDAGVASNAGTGPDLGRASADEAFALYCGSFVDENTSEAWALTYREKLHARYVRAILDAGARLEKRGDFNKALACYEQGLERDGLVEAFHQCVLTCCIQLGRRAEGLNAYARCRERLSEALGVVPSQQTEDLRMALLTDQ